MTEPGRSRTRPGPSRTAYLVTTLCLAGGAVAASAGAGWGDPGAVAAGAFGAWAIQAVAYWRLVAALDQRGAAIRTWVLGMGARFGGLVLAFVAATLAPEEGASLLLAFGGAILVFLLLEATWLALRPPEPIRRRRAPAEGSGVERVEGHG